MEVPQQKLPAVESGHYIPKGSPGEQKLPRVEGEGVKDAPGDPNYPKMVPHPIHGTVKAMNAEHEDAIAAEVAALPPAPPQTAIQARDTEIENQLGRPMTDSEKAFIAELELASRKVRTLSPGVLDSSLDVDPVGTPIPVPDSPADVEAKYRAEDAHLASITAANAEDGELPAHVIETKNYADGVSATGMAPLPDVSPNGAQVVAEEIPAPPVPPTSEPPAEIAAAVAEVDKQAEQV